MIDQILDLVKQFGQQSVVANKEVPDNYNNAVMAEAASTITGGFQNMLGGGGLESIISMFTGRQSQSQSGLLGNPIVSMMVGHLTNKLISKMNLNPAVANGIANNIIPGVLNSIVSKTNSNDPSNDSFDLNDLVAAFTGGNPAANNTQTNGIDLQDILSQFTGGGNGQQPDLTNIIGNITQKAQQPRTSGGGGLTDIIGGFFK
ncbi:hypothetical protein GCM10027051_20090 [Niabella terrae]